MEKEFILKEDAVELKSIGFNEDCAGYYNTLDRPMCGFAKHSVQSAPLYSQAFRWFREEHGYHGEVIQTTNKYNVCREEFQYGVCKYHQKPFYYETYNNFEDAQLACLRKLIKIIKDENK